MHISPRGLGTRLAVSLVLSLSLCLPSAPAAPSAPGGASQPASGGKVLSEQEKRILEQKDHFAKEDTAITQAGWGMGMGPSPRQTGAWE